MEIYSPKTLAKIIFRVHNKSVRLQIKKRYLIFPVLIIFIIFIGLILFILFNRPKKVVEDLKCNVQSQQRIDLPCGVNGKSANEKVYFVAGKVSNLKKGGNKYKFDLITLDNKKQRVVIPVVLPSGNMTVGVIEVDKIGNATNEQPYTVPNLSSEKLFNQLKEGQNVTIQLPLHTASDLTLAKKFTADPYFFECAPLNKIIVNELENDQDIQLFDDLYYNYFKGCRVMVFGLSL